MKIIKLPFKIKKPMLACGADLKGAFALAKGNKAYLVEGFGPLSDPDNLRAYETSVCLHEKKLGIRPRVIACDHHPGYISTQFAEVHGLEMMVPDLCDVQHHEAHIASAMVEHSIKSDVIGVAFDGTGYGWDGRIWGGEFFTGNLRSFRRAAHFEYIPMPGGDAAIRQPWRMSASYLYKSFGPEFMKKYSAAAAGPRKKGWPVIKRMIDGKINSPLTSSVGRLFDAAGSLILSEDRAAFEAELPIKLERIASSDYDDCYKFAIRSDDGVLVVDASKVIKGIVGDLREKTDRGVMSAKFHNTIAEIAASVASRLRRRSGLNKVLLSGGVFQNKYLTNRAVSLLRENNFNVYVHNIVNTNDYGIPVGQLAIANVRPLCA